MSRPLHWSPGAPLAFSVPYRLFGDRNDIDRDIPAIYWQQALITTGTTALVAALAWILAGPWAGVIAGALIATYPPLFGVTGERLSEPLGAFLLTAAFLVLALASRRRSSWWVWALAGATFGLAVLARTNLLPMPFLIAGLGAAAVLIKQRSLRPALLTWGMVGVAAAVTLAPWSIFASNLAGRFVPVSEGSASTLFIGTYLPGGGTTFGTKQQMEPQLRARYPKYDDLGVTQISAAKMLDMVAERHPNLSRDDALRREARINLRRYMRGQPLAFMRMQWSKADRMWMDYFRGGGVDRVWQWIRVWHIVLVLACGAGLLAGLLRRRDPILAAVLLTILVSTLIHSIMVSQARYNLPLMPSLIAAGVAGWFLAVRRPEPSEPVAAPARSAADTIPVS